MKLMKIVVTDNYLFAQNGNVTPRWSTIVPANDYQAAIELAASKFQPPFAITVIEVGELEDKYLKGTK